MSTNSGVAPQYKIAFDVAKKVIGVVRIISFLFQPNARTAKCRATVPFETAEQYFAPKFFFKAFSNFSIDGTEL